MTIITLALVWKCHTGQHERRIWSESMTGKKVSDCETAGTNKNKGTNLKKPRLSARFWRNLATTTTHLGQSEPNQNYPLCFVDRPPRAHPMETE
jgi:hypothetical protein